MVTKTGKWLYCPCCQGKPDEIVEHYKEVEENRIWNEDMDCYELTDSSLGEPYKSTCGSCGAILENR